MNPAPAETDEGVELPSRSTLLRDVVVLQFKLVVDGLRDFILVPISLVAGLLSLLRAGPKPGTEFYDLLRYGRRSDRIINLFGAASRVHGHAGHDEHGMDIDDLVQRVEDYVADEARRDNMTAQARAGLEKLRRVIDRQVR